jgi:hypothetical protein
MMDLNSNPGEDPEPHGSLRLMDFRKGTNHPLAAIPTVQLQSEGKRMNVYDTYDAHMEAAGDNIIVMITQARALPDFIYVVGWKTGSVSLVSSWRGPGSHAFAHALIFPPQILTAPDLTYASSFALIDAEVLALVNIQTNTLDIHRLVGAGGHTSKNCTESDNSAYRFPELAPSSHILHRFVYHRHVSPCLPPRARDISRSALRQTPVWSD